jgi:hypothetical protein
MSSYKFKHPAPRPVFGALPEGDYGYTVSECGEPYQKNDKWILPVKLAIQPDGTPVWANPWQGQTSAGEERDQIAEFLVSCNRAPKVGEEPDWDEVVGARGRCRLKIEIAQMGALAGKEVNKVAYFLVPKQVGSIAEERAQRSTQKEYAKEQAATVRKASGKDPDLDVEPDDIPF